MFVAVIRGRALLCMGVCLSGAGVSSYPPRCWFCVTKIGEVPTAMWPHWHPRTGWERVLLDTDESALRGIERKPNQRMDPPAATFFSFVLTYQVQAVSYVRSHWCRPSVTYTHWWLGVLQIIKQGLRLLQEPCGFLGKCAFMCASSAGWHIYDRLQGNCFWHFSYLEVQGRKVNMFFFYQLGWFVTKVLNLSQQRGTKVFKKRSRHMMKVCTAMKSHLMVWWVWFICFDLCGHQNITQLNTYGISGTNALDSVLHHNHQNTEWGNMLWKNAVHQSSRIPEICVKEL